MSAKLPAKPLNKTAIELMDAVRDTVGLENIKDPEALQARFSDICDLSGARLDVLRLRWALRELVWECESLTSFFECIAPGRTFKRASEVAEHLRRLAAKYGEPT